MKSKKPFILNHRMEEIQEELDRIRHDVRLLSKFVDKPTRPVDFARLKTASLQKDAAAPAAPGRPAASSDARPLVSAPTARPWARSSSVPSPAATEPAASPAVSRERSSPHDGRLADYLATNFQPVRPLRHERRIQRNKAIVMVIFVIIVFFLVLNRLLS